LTGIVGLSRVLLTRIERGSVDPAQQIRQLEMIQNCAARSLQTVERVVDLARIDAGRLRCDPRAVDCAAVAADAITVLLSAADARGLRLRAETPGPVLVETDPVLLGKVLHELLDNAVRHADPGDVVVSVRTDPVRIEVRDAGPGVPSADRERIFGAFERGDRAAERDDGGCGLGLYLARRLADLLGARLAVRGEPTTFSVTFPGSEP
jgi:signal transduction histidine kinase